jgi:hypothetical protein
MKMIFLKDNSGGSPSRSIKARTSRTAPKNIVRLALLIAGVGITLASSIESRVLARAQGAADAKQAPAIEPAAIEGLNKMGVYLRSLKSFQVQADITSDDVLDDGQIIQSSKKVDIVAAKPNRLRVEVVGEDEHRFYFFDGRNFTIFGRLVNYYATAPAPPTIAELVDQVEAKYGIELPLLDLFYWGTNDEVTKRLKGGIDAGPREVDGVTCEQYVFHQEQIDWQVWIQLGEFPLPRKLVIRTLTDYARPQYSEKLTWNLAPSFSEDAFTFDPPPDAHRIPIAEVRAATGSNK